MSALDAFGGTLMATGLFAWLLWLHTEIQQTTYAYRLRVVTRRKV